jgi:glucose/arabinose dehydrogenase
MRRRVVFGALGLAATALALAAGLCRLTPLDCHLRGGEEQDYFRGLAGYGLGPTRLPAGFRQEIVASGLTLPTSLAILPDSALLVAEKRGVVWRFQAGRRLRRPVLDLRARVNDFGYRGLLAIELDPRFVQNRQIVTLYVREDGARSREAAKTSRVSRFTLGGRRVRAAATEQVVLGAAGTRPCEELARGADCLPVDGDHAGGDLEFARDGTLFVSTGDGWNGSPGFNPRPLRAQGVDWLAGKLLRVDGRGRGLPTNPFWNGDPRANRSKVWALGLRNPFRFSLWLDHTAIVGDVGWNEREELALVRRGENHGWPCLEGDRRPPEYARRAECRALYARGQAAPPVVTYARGSVTGGVFYRGRTFPAAFRGSYLYGDWSRHWLRRLTPDRLAGAAGNPQPFAENAGGPVELRVGPDGSLYYVATNAGEVRRIVYAGR